LRCVLIHARMSRGRHESLELGMIQSRPCPGCLSVSVLPSPQKKKIKARTCARPHKSTRKCITHADTTQAYIRACVGDSGTYTCVGCVSATEGHRDRDLPIKCPRLPSVCINHPSLSPPLSLPLFTKHLRTKSQRRQKIAEKVLRILA
jgi:hypothetical protein